MSHGQKQIFAIFQMQEERAWLAEPCTHSSLAGIMEYAEVLGQYLVPLLLICVVSTVLTFAATALSVRAVLALMERGKGRV